MDPDYDDYEREIDDFFDSISDSISEQIRMQNFDPLTFFSQGDEFNPEWIFPEYLYVRNEIVSLEKNIFNLKEEIKKASKEDSKKLTKTLNDSKNFLKTMQRRKNFLEQNNPEALNARIQELRESRLRNIKI